MELAATPDSEKKTLSIYDGDLDFNDIRESPILKPISEINDSYINLELLINKALLEYQVIEDEINLMLKENPIYSETMLMARIENLKNQIKQIIHSQDLQKESMKSKINEMIKIVSEEYELIRGEEEFITGKEETKKKDKEEAVKKPEFFSDLVGRKIPAQKEDES